MEWRGDRTLPDSHSVSRKKRNAIFVPPSKWDFFNHLERCFSEYGHERLSSLALIHSNGNRLRAISHPRVLSSKEALHFCNVFGLRNSGTKYAVQVRKKVTHPQRREKSHFDEHSSARALLSFAPEKLPTTVTCEEVSGRARTRAGDMAGERLNPEDRPRRPPSSDPGSGSARNTRARGAEADLLGGREEARQHGKHETQLILRLGGSTVRPLVRPLRRRRQ